MIHSVNDIRLRRAGVSQLAGKPSVRRVTLTRAFGFAFYGLFLFFKMERNGKIQLAMSLLVIVCGIAFHISPSEWMYVLLCIAAVLSLEMMNSAIEKLCDLVCKDYNPAIKIIKDVAAGAVLWTALLSVVIACFIFLPKLMILCFSK